MEKIPKMSLATINFYVIVDNLIQLMKIKNLISPFKNRRKSTEKTVFYYLVRLLYFCTIYLNI